jgi:hypothetical protein
LPSFRRRFTLETRPIRQLKDPNLHDASQ